MKYSIDNNRLVSMIETINKMQFFCIEGEDKTNLNLLGSMLMAEFRNKDVALESGDTQSNRKYTIAPPDELRKVCIDNNLFTCADVDQYDRFFNMNESGADFDLIVSYAYACSDVVSYMYIRDIFESARNQYQEVNQDSYELDN